MSSAENPTNWRKSTRSSNQTDCVEVGRVADGAAVRDTKDRTAGHLTPNRAQWAAFIAAIKSDRYM